MSAVAGHGLALDRHAVRLAAVVEHLGVDALVGLVVVVVEHAQARDVADASDAAAAVVVAAAAGPTAQGQGRSRREPHGRDHAERRFMTDSSSPDAARPRGDVVLRSPLASRMCRIASVGRSGPDRHRPSPGRALRDSAAGMTVLRRVSRGGISSIAGGGPATSVEQPEEDLHRAPRDVARLRGHVGDRRLALARRVVVHSPMTETSRPGTQPAASSGLSTGCTMPRVRHHDAEPSRRRARRRRARPPPRAGAGRLDRAR